jgi:hypothetical protein
MTTLALETEISAGPAAIWALAGDFGGLDQWHPWVPDCRLSEDGKTRSIGSGAMEAIEVLESWSDDAMTYTVTKSPMPVANYRCTWTVSGGPERTTLAIQATFEAVGVPEETAVAMLTGFFEAAFSTLAARL